MKATFLVPPVLVGDRATERVAGCTYTLYPVPNIYELTVVGLIEREGFDVRYVESVLNNWDRDDFKAFLKNDDSDVYIMYTVNLGIQNDIVAHSLIREFRGNVPVVFQGPGPTHFVADFMLDDNTFVVRGEPDHTLLELLRSLEMAQRPVGVAGVSYPEQGERIDNENRPLIKDLDSLPFPARHLLPEKLRYQFRNPKLKVGPYTAVVSSRNCPYKCIYCVPSSLSFARELEYRAHNDGKKPPVGMRSVENVIAEINHLADEGYKAISFQDDNFVWTEKRMIPIAEALGKRGIIWGCQSRADRLTEPIVEAMAKNGCQYVDIGVESFNQDILDFVRKDTTVEQMKTGIDLLKKYGISAKINVLIGTSPLETVETIRENEKIIRDLDVDQVMFSITAPFPGTEFYDMAKENGWFVDGDYYPTDVQKKAIIRFPNLSDKDLEREVYRCNRRFFLRPKIAFRHIKRFRSFRDFTTASKALYRKLWA